MNRIDKFLNSFTMYRIVLYGLGFIVLWAFILSAYNILGYSLPSLCGSLALVITVGFGCHWLLVRLFRSAPNTESWLITVLILFLILKPAETLGEFSVLALGVIFAMASKYVFTFGRRHLFNPIAIALLFLDLIGCSQVFWWVGSGALFTPVLIVSFLIVRKIRRFDMVIAFLAVAIATYSLRTGISIQTFSAVVSMITSGPLIFFAGIMLTEPQTSPHTRMPRLIFSVIVGFLFGIAFSLPPLYSTPELALVIGNAFAFIFSSKRRLRLVYQGYTLQGEGIYEFSFLPDKPLNFRPGQYLEWTLPHHRADNRGDRRFFTIASSPTEDTLKLAARIDPQHSSSFKRALLGMEPGNIMWASLLSGDFVLPTNLDKPLVFIAGGIGITPFRSMVRQLVDRNEHRTMTLYYTSQSATGFSYWKLFNQATANGLRPQYFITGKDIPEGWTGRTGFLSKEIIQSDVADYTRAFYYLSGPNVMVVSYKKMLSKAGIPRRHIKTDYFPGF